MDIKPKKKNRRRLKALDSPINIDDLNDKPSKPEREVIDMDVERKRPRKEAWKTHRLIRDQDILKTTPPEKVLEIAKTKLPGLRERALFLILYICAARVEEIVNYKYILWGQKEVVEVSLNKRPRIAKRQDYKNKKVVGEYENGICKNNIAEEIFAEVNVIVFAIRNLKSKKIKRKRIPFVLDKPCYIEMWNIIKTYISGLSDEEPLFDFGRRRAANLIKPTGWNPHSLRALRLTHMVRFHNFADQKLRLLSGWTDTRPAERYVRLDWEDLVESMKS